MLRTLFPRLLIFLILTGCASTVKNLEQDLISVRESPPMDVMYSEALPLPEQYVHNDIKLACTFLLYQLRHADKATPYVSVAEGAPVDVAEPAFDYGGFEVSHISITNYLVVDEGSGRIRLEGFFHFTDLFNKRCTAGFATMYRIRAKKGVVIDFAAAWPVYRDFPTMQAFFVPTRAFEEAETNPFASSLELHAFVLDNAVSMYLNDEEKADLEAHEALSTLDRLQQARDPGEPYTIVVLALDRLFPDAKVDIRVSDNKYSATESNITPIILDEKGFRALLFGGDMVFNKSHRQFWVHVFYTPGSDRPPKDRGDMLALRFTNMKTDGRAQPGSRKPAYTPGPLEQGTQLLSVKNRDQARIVQSRLAELGHYTMAIDGLWGKGSSKALNEFKASRGMARDGVWNAPTQMELFRGTGR